MDLKSRPVKVLVGALAATVALVPAIVLARGGNGPSGQGELIDQVVWSSGIDQPLSTNSKEFASIPNMSFPTDSLWENPVTVDVTAEMTSGSARFRVVADPAVTVLRPGETQFVGKGGATALFFTAGSDLTQVQNFDVQWRRVGKNPARAVNVVARAVGEIDPT